MRRSVVPSLVLAALLPLLPCGLRGQDPPPIVHALLFFSPACPHCHQVINEHLIPMQNRWGNRLVILAFDVTQRYANPVYMGAMRRFEVPQNDWVVPILVVGDEIMIGGEEIPSRFPGQVEKGLAAGGIDIPDIPEVMAFLEGENLLETRFPGRRMTRLPPGMVPEPAPPQPDTPAVAAAKPADTTANWSDTTARRADSAAAPRDSAAARPGAPAPDSGAARGVTVAPAPARGPAPVPAAAPDTSPPRAGMGPGETLPVPDTRVGAAAEAPAPVGLEQAAQRLESVTMGERFRQDPVGNSASVAVLLIMALSLAWTGYPPRARGRSFPAWTVPALVVLGAGVAAYLSFVEVTHAEAVCGPVGDCNTVNQSEYARLFGTLPVGVLGLLGYGVILVLWLLARGGPQGARPPAALALWGAAFVGTVFSLYLTFLEPFVIGATCAWCLTSALVMTALLWATAPLAARSWPGTATDRNAGEAGP